MLATPLVTLTGALALLAVSVPATWSLTRGLVTTVHEAGHAAVALAVGRRLHRVRLHGVGGGDTVTSGRTSGPGLVATLAAGYPAPSLLGLGCAGWLGSGRPAEAVLLLGLIAVGGMLLVTRNPYGLLLLVASGGVLAVGVWRASEQAQSFEAYVITWFLLIGGLRAVGVLLRARRARAGTDADQLARLTAVPGVVWVLLFSAVNLAALLLGAGWLLGLRWSA